MDFATKQRELDELHARVEALEAEIAREEAALRRRALRDYPVYHATVGCLLGVLGAAISLIFNVIGALAAGKNPLQIIRVYLTFPLGENALRLTDQAQNVYAVSDGMIVAFGCCLYLVTGMVLGIPIALALAWFAPRRGMFRRLVVGGIAGLVVWGTNFYGILAWLQPALFGGRWITDNTHLPWWVAAATHVVFGWTIAVLFPVVEESPVNESAVASV